MTRVPIILLILLLSVTISAQSIDKVEAVIGDEIVLTSEIESQYLQYLSQGGEKSPAIRCEIVEDLLFQKLLLNQAKLDSVTISNDEVEQEIAKRLTYFERQLGSIEKVEAYFKKSVVDIELELKKVIKDQFQAQRMQSQITSNIKVTPAEVKDVFLSLNENDIPIIPTQVEIAQIVIKPEISEEQKDKIREKLNNFRERVYKGEDFKVLATLYSDDPGSAIKGGELGFVNRGDLVPEFERAAFRLKEGEISEVVASEFGFHIVQLIERRGEQINVRHILIKAKANATASRAAQLKADEIIKEINSEAITFDDAVVKYSDDDSKKNGGLLLNPNTMSTMHTLNDMSASLKLKVQSLEVGDISSPAIIQLADESAAYRILKLNKKVELHTANLVDDFTTIKDFAVNAKKQEVLLKWINKTISRTFIKLNKGIASCDFKNNWIK
jgi:peptidyl-prolyl cis-trans isomerase SurA